MIFKFPINMSETLHENLEESNQAYATGNI